MFKKTKLNRAAKRVQSRKNAQPSFWRRVWNIICWPFRMIGRVIARIWAWIRGLDLIGLLNLTLLIAIIVLFSMLVIDIVKCTKKPTVVVTDVPAVTVVPTRSQVVVTNRPAPASVKKHPTLPLRRDPITRKFKDHTITTARANKSGAQRTLSGDIIIDRRDATPVLSDGVRINGNLYLQNMHKYTLPCGTHINGNLFLRDLGMLQFCGDFTVTGNIYVSPRSSFGPLPRSARLGGQIIL